MFKLIATVVVTIDTAEIDRWLEQEAQVRLDLVEQRAPSEARRDTSNTAEEVC